jgi:hypothetical protein
MTTIPMRHLILAVTPFLALACTSGEQTGGDGGASGAVGAAGSSATGSGGGSGQGGSTGRGGALGSGGAPTGPGGSGGGGGPATGGVTGTCATPTSANPLISDFSGTTTTAVAMQANGGTDVWTVSPAGMGSAIVMGGEMHATTTGGDWASMSTPIGGHAPCLDMSRYTGVSFKIRSASVTSLIFEVATVETAADFSHMRKTIAVTPTYTAISVPFNQLERAPFGAGMSLPADYKPQQHMFAIAFGVDVMTELLDVFLDDVTFY